MSQHTDRHGTAIREGDEVLVRCRVKKFFPVPGTGGEPCPCTVAGDYDDRILTSTSEIVRPQVLTILYRNYKGVTAVRQIVPYYIRFGTTPHHQEPQALLESFDLDKKEPRTFALKDVLSWDAKKVEATSAAEILGADDCDAEPTG